MRSTVLIVIATAAGLGACAPVPAPYGYGYAPAPAPVSYGYYDGAYAPGPYYAEPAYAPYATPGPAIVIGGERRYDGGDRYRYDRPGNDGAYRGYPNQPNRDFGRNQPPRDFGGNRPGPAAVAARPGPAPQAAPPPPPSGGRAAEQWNRTHVNASSAFGEGQSR